MKKVVIAAASSLGLVVATLVWMVAASGPANAGCDPPGTVYYRTKALGTRYHGTRMRSDWAHGGQRVTVRKGRTVKSGVTTIKNSTHSIDVGAEWGPIQASYNYTHSSTHKVARSRSYTLSQSYRIRVPNGKSAREMRWRRKMRIRVIKETTRNPCDIVVVGRAVVEAPLAGHAFVWDYQDEPTMLPGCRVKGYPSHGSC